jgi:hypothetical protein
MSNCIYVGDEGTVFKVKITDCDTGAIIDLTPVSVKQIVFKKPTGVVVTQTAVFTTDGSDGYIEYTSAAGDLDMSGTWSIQGHVESAGFKNSSSVSTFSVSDVIVNLLAQVVSNQTEPGDTHFASLVGVL